MGLYSLDNYYSLSTWYENTCAYDLWTGTDLMLDLARNILASDAYIFQGIGFPKGADISLMPGQTFSGSLNLTPYSYVLSLSGFSANANQFTVRIYDKGAQTDVYQKQFAWFPTVIGNLQGTFNEGQILYQNTQDVPFGPYIFRDPLIILPPGVLQIQLTNVAPNDTQFGVLPSEQTPNLVQMFFGIAVPKNTVSLQNRALQTSSDPTGTTTLQGATSLYNVFGG
jgi:hypothetical protein